MAVTQISKDSFQKDVLDYKGIVFIDFYADWCVAPNTEILLNTGEHILAKNVRSGDNLIGLGKRGKRNGSVIFSTVVADGGHCKNITVETGRSIKVTDDHMFYTQNGWIAANKLQLGSKVAVYPTTVFSNKQQKTAEKELILSRLTGFLFSDGTIYYQKKNNYYEISFTVGQKDDIKALKLDLAKLGFSRTHLREVSKKQEISGREFISHTFRLKCLSKDLFNLLVKRGVPIGAKKSQHYLVPAWIKKGSNSIKREFLRGYLGGDGPKVTIRLSKVKNRGSYNTININDLEFHKDSRLEGSALEFAKEISTLLKDFNVIVNRIYVEKDNYLRNDGQKSSIIHLQFKHDYTTGLAVSDNIGYAYCRQKQQTSELSGEFLREIFYLRKTWEDLYQKAKRLSSLGYGYRRISRILKINPTQAWTWIKGKAKATIAHHGLKFNSWVKEKLKKAPDGFIWEKIVKIKSVFLPTVARITVNPTHSFVANGFLSHNCAPCKVTSPIITELSEEMKNIKFVEVNVDQNPELAQQYMIFSIPTFMIFKDGKLATQFVGAMGKEGFLNEINKVVSS